MSGWPEAALGDLCDITIGKTPPRAERKYWGVGMPWLSIADMNQGRDLRVTKEQVTRIATDGPAGRLVQPGTLLLSFKLSVGKVGFSRVPMYTNEAIAALPIKGESRICPDFLYWALKRADLLRDADDAAMGKNLNKKKLAEFVVPLPSPAEQRRIAAVLDQAEILRVRRREAIALLDDLIQSIFLDMFGDPSANIRSFEVRELEDLVVEGDRINYGVVQPGRHVDGGVPLIRSGDLGRFGVDRSSLMQISPNVESSYSRSRIKGNEVLIGCVGAIGEVSIVGPDDVGSNVARAVARVPVAGDVDREYLAAYLRMDFVQHYFTRELRTVAQPTLNIKQIKSTPVVFPPSHLRSEFAERARSVTRQRSVHVAHLATLDELFASLQHRAFSGVLWDHEAPGEAA
ncbi:restriction endonuclease subunit S [Streptomyces rubiginosohelvolus]